MSTNNEQRPERWAHPLDPGMTADDVSRLLAMPPFCDMDASRFAASTRLEEILRYDCRILRFREGDMIFREGQYGGSAYLVLQGSVAAAVLRMQSWAGDPRRRKGWLRWWRSAVRSARPGGQERRRRPRTANAPQHASNRSAGASVGGAERSLHDASTGLQLGTRGEGAQTRIFLQDVPGVLNRTGASLIPSGGLFGELAAATRAPRDFTAVAAEDCTVLEIRWQGLKLLQQDPSFRDRLNERYRQDALAAHLRETSLFRFLPEGHMEHVVSAAHLESFGQLEWFARYRRESTMSPNQRIEAEPLIAREGEYASGVWVIRSGFARLSWRQGVGHRTLAYLGKGDVFGWRELVHNCVHQPDAAPLPWQYSLRAIGYVDAIWIPKQVLVDHVMPFVRQRELPSPLSEPRYAFGQPLTDAPIDSVPHQVEPGLLEFLVDHRLNNGQRTMIVDLERCTRCDDCVRACAATHGGTPVFERTGPIYQHWMFPQACMHCEDPVCMIGCPTGAIHRHVDSGLVEIEPSTCIGCKTCAESCPYGNIRMVETEGQDSRTRADVQSDLPLYQASKCDFCTARGNRPACYDACPHDALVRIDTSDMDEVERWWNRRAS